MHVEKTIISESEITLIITATAEDLESSKQKVLKKLSKDVKLPGFRAGNAPLQLIEKNIEPSILQSEFLDEAMTDLYSRASQQENVRPVTQPNVNIKKFVPFTMLEFEVSTSVIGQVKLGKYKGLTTKVKDKKVTEADVKDLLETLRTRMSEKKSVERGSKEGDEATIDFKGVDSKGVPVNGADGKDYPLVIGSNSFIPGFEDNIIGMKTGDEKSFTLTFPKDYGVKALASKKVTFTVNLKSVNELIKPKLDDDLASKAGPFKTLKELKDDVRKQLEQESSNEVLRAKQNELLKQVVDNSQVAIPQALIDQQVTYELDELRRNLTYRGQTFAEFIESEKTTEDKYKAEVVEPNARDQVKTGIILSEIAEKESLIVTPEELEIQLQMLKAQYTDPTMQQQLEKPEARRDIASRMLSQKVVNFIVDSAKV